MRSVIKLLNAHSIALIEIQSRARSMARHGWTVNTSPAGVDWEVFNHHPPYSSVLAPSDFLFVLRLKKFLPDQRQRFQNNKEAEMCVTVVPIPGGRFL